MEKETRKHQTARRGMIDNGAIDMLEIRNPIQRDLGRLEELTHVNLMKYKETRCKVMHLGGEILNINTRKVDEGIENSSAEKKFRIQGN